MIIHDEPTAYEIAYDLLRTTEKGLREGDFATFAQCFLLPHEHVTTEGLAVLESEDDLRAVFDAVRTRLKANRVDQIIRQVIAAHRETPHKIFTQAQSRFYASGVLVTGPYDVRSVLIRCGPEWRISSANYSAPLSGTGMGHALMHDRFPSEASGTPKEF